MHHEPVHERRVSRRWTTAVGTAFIALSLSAPSAGASPAKATPNPLETPDLAGCHGNLNATFNHNSGVQEHGKDSKGPGWYFRDGRLFQEVRSEVWPIFCGPGAGTP